MSSSPVPAAPLPPSDPARPLLVTGDETLLDELLRLAAAAGVDVEAAAEPSLARPRWRQAPLVVLGDDVSEQALRLGLPRRDGVVLVGTDLDDAEVWPRAVGLGAEHVVFLPDGESWLVERFADTTEDVPGASTVLAVVGGRGGAGASTLAAGVAVTAVRRGLRTLLVDADPLGGGIDLALGGEHEQGLRWPELADTSGRVSGSALRSALPRVGGMGVLSWDRSDLLEVPSASVCAVLEAGTRAADLVVVDAPRRVDDATEEVLARASTTLLVVPAEVRATAAAARVAASVAPHTVDVRLVVRGPAPSGLRGDTIAEALGLPLAGEMRADPGVVAALERGEPPARSGRGNLARLCARLLDEMVPVDRAAVA